MFNNPLVISVIGMVQAYGKPKAIELVRSGTFELKEAVESTESPLDNNLVADARDVLQEALNVLDGIEQRAI